MEMVNVTFDFVLLAVAVWMVLVVGRSGLGGVIGNTLNFITIGAIVLGLAHLSETITFEVLHLENVALGEFLHRIIVLAGFVCLVVGFQGLTRLRRT
jgi:hypothetical protein